MIGVGYSAAKNPRTAAEEAVTKALAMVKGHAQHACIVFATVGYSQSVLLEEVRKKVGDVPMVGCSGAGVIAPGVADESNHCLVVMLLADPRIRLRTAAVARIDDSHAAGRDLGKSLGLGIEKDARCLLLFPCGLNAVMDDLVPALEEHLGADLPIIGGLAADNLLRDKTYQYHNWRVYEGGVSAAILSGDFDLITDVSHGCVPIGLEMEVTKAQGNRLHEIDHRPVMDVLTECVGEGIIKDFGKVALHFCIGQLTDSDLTQSYDRYIIRYIAKYDAASRSISLPVKMEIGNKIWVTRRDRDKMFAASGNSIKKLREKLGARIPFLVMDINCVGRGKIVLADSEKHDLLHTFQNNLAPGIPWIGFFSYGEFCPIGRRNIFHNYTDVFALFVWR